MKISLKNNHFDEQSCNDGSILLIDIDNFKLINDQYGHHAGDLALQKISKQLKKGIRKGDIICRWGGEEFLILLRHTDISVAYKRAETFRKLIEKLTLSYNEQVYNLTISIGVSEINQETTASEIINAADEHLYEAKHNGKNQVC